MYSIAICDDMPDHLTAMRAAVEQALPERELRLQTYGGVDELLSDCAEGGNCDILLLDILMPERDGIGAAQEINRVSPATQIIFVSAYADYALEAYEAEHLYFLKKPVQIDKLRIALLRAVERIERQRDARLILPLRGGLTRVLSVNEILYFERRRHVTFVTFDGGVLETALKLSDIETLLPEADFARPHNSYLVALHRVKSASRTAVSLDDGSALPISNLRRAAFHEALSRSI